MSIYLLLLTAFASGMYPAAAADPVENTALAGGTAQIAELPSDRIREVRTLWVTAYSSTPEETDDTPFITAMGTKVRDGIVATNLLPFKTRVKIPRLFGDKIFVVEDRMHQRKTKNLDIWMASKKEALEFGSAYTEIVVLD